MKFMTQGTLKNMPSYLHDDQVARQERMLQDQRAKQEQQKQFTIEYGTAIQEAMGAAKDEKDFAKRYNEINKAFSNKLSLPAMQFGQKLAIQFGEKQRQEVKDKRDQITWDQSQAKIKEDKDYQNFLDAVSTSPNSLNDGTPSQVRKYLAALQKKKDAETNNLLDRKKKEAETRKINSETRKNLNGTVNPSTNKYMESQALDDISAWAGANGVAFDKDTKQMVINLDKTGMTKNEVKQKIKDWGFRYFDREGLQDRDYWFTGDDHILNVNLGSYINGAQTSKGKTQQKTQVNNNDDIFNAVTKSNVQQKPNIPNKLVPSHATSTRNQNRNLPSDPKTWKVEITAPHNAPLISSSANQVEESARSFKKAGRNIKGAWDHAIKPGLETAQNMLITQPWESSKYLGNKIIDAVTPGDIYTITLPDGTKRELSAAEIKQYQISKTGNAQPKKDNYGKRADGNPKGPGFLGEIKNADGSISTEVSVGVDIGGKEIEIPLLVPGLTKEEIKNITEGGQISDSIVKKAVAHAKARIAKGLSPFKEAGE